MWNGLGTVLWLQDLRLGLPSWFSELISLFSDVLYLVLPLLLTLFLCWCADRRTGSAAVLSLTFTLAAVSALKGLLAVPRPWDLDPRVEPEPTALSHASGLSCPSGHVAAASTSFGLLAWLRRKDLRVVVLCAALILITAFTRLYLGVHTPLDVAAGLFLGLAAAAAAVATGTWMERRPGRDRYVFLLMLAVVLAAMAATGFLPSDFVGGKPVVDRTDDWEQVCRYGGLTVGAVVGWFIERRLVRFDPLAPRRRRRFVIGLCSSLAVFALVLGLGTAMGAEDLGYLAGGFLFSLYALAGFPWLARRYGL